DTTKALGDLGRAQRLQWNGPLVAVTGSVGKTTVKDMTAHLLSGYKRVLKSEGNLNNQYGLPLTLLKLNETHEAAVVELGINHPGEMERLSEIARPDVAVVTAIGEAHLGFFKNRRHLAAEKLKVGSALNEGGFMVLNADDALLNTTAKNDVTFGLKLGQVKAKNLRVEGFGTRFTLAADGVQTETRIQVPGVHNVSNALAAVSAGLALGFPLRALAERLRKFVSKAPMRMEMKNIRGVLFINDAYNASPTSMEAALDTFKAIKGPKYKIAVLGDMLEMGAYSREAHLRIARLVTGYSFDAVILVGNQMRGAFQSLNGEEAKKTQWFSEPREVASFLRRSLEKGDAVLLKASRGMKLERILEKF
ncbi:MAG TPA: UDP-N-acetylmuramoyl-tripeptide--D-alanyl-D-alanine ligase, partial [bacterium]